METLDTALAILRIHRDKGSESGANCHLHPKGQLFCHEPPSGQRTQKIDRALECIAIGLKGIATQICHAEVFEPFDFA